MTAGIWDTTIEQGATWRRVLTWTDTSGEPIDLTDFTARMALRRQTDRTQSFMLTTENGQIALGGAAGTITLSLSATDTESLPAVSHVYDLELVSPDGIEVTRLLEGMCIVSQEVTT